MEITIDLKVLAAFMGIVLFLLTVLALIYLILVLHQVHKGTTVLRRLLEKNEKTIDGTVKDIAETTGTIKNDLLIPVKAVAEIVTYLKKLALRKMGKIGADN